MFYPRYFVSPSRQAHFQENVYGDLTNKKPQDVFFTLFRASTLLPLSSQFSAANPLRPFTFFLEDQSDPPQPWMDVQKDAAAFPGLFATGAFGSCLYRLKTRAHQKI